MTEEVKTETTAIAEYSEVDAQLAVLREKYAGKVYDVTTGAGLDVARRDRAVVRAVRTGLEKIRKDIKEPALQRCRDIDKEAKRITVEIVKIEQPIDDTIKHEENRKAEEKAKREAAEKERVAGHTQVIVEISQYPVGVVGKTAAEIKDMIGELDDEDLSKLEEFKGEAEGAKRVARGIMVNAMNDKIAEEEQEEARRLDAVAEKQRLDEIRKAADEKTAKEKAELEAEKQQVAADKKALEDKEEASEAERQSRAAEQKHNENILKAKCDSQNTALCEIFLLSKQENVDIRKRMNSIAVIAEANMEVDDDGA